MTDAILAIDLSHHNTVTDLHQVAAAGIVGIIHKCTQGTTFLDDDYHARKAQAAEAGLAWSAYHYLEHGNVRQQMEWFIDNCDLEAGARACVDYEEEGCTLDDLTEAIEVLTEQAPDLELTVYSGHLIKEHLGNGTDPILEQTSLWLAQYGDTPSWPRGCWATWSLWQYTDQGSVPGIAGNVDCNRFNGSADQCRKWFGPVDYPTPQPVERTVAVSIEAPADVTVTLTVNGEKVA